MAAAGDRRALDHPFLRNFPTWMTHHLQPGRFLVNAFDAGGSRSPRQDGTWRGLLAKFVVFGGNPTARWALKTLWDGPPADLVGMLAQASDGPTETPPLFAQYGMATRVNWRDSWDDQGTGVWVRGGHRLDSHDHRDRGHVNFISKGRPILIEAGCPSYDNPRIHILYTTVIGHNVLDIEGVTVKKTPAPVSTQRLDAQGGEVTVDPTAGYPGLKSWTRSVKWTAEALDVADHVTFPEGQQGKPLFRWHLGTQEDVAITGEGAQFHIAWADAEIALTGSAPIQVTQEKLPDNTVKLGKKENDWDFLHTCVVVRAVSPCQGFDLATHVKPK